MCACVCMRVFACVYARVRRFFSYNLCNYTIYYKTETGMGGLCQERFDGSGRGERERGMGDWEVERERGMGGVGGENESERALGLSLKPCALYSYIF